MKEIFIYTYRDSGKVFRIDLRKPKMTDDEIDAAIRDYNSSPNDNLKVGRYRVVDAVYEALRFLTGEEEYATTRKISDLLYSLKEVKEEIEIISRSTDDLADSIENTITEIKDKL